MTSELARKRCVPCTGVWTDKINGLTESDFILAAKVGAAAGDGE